MIKLTLSSIILWISFQGVAQINFYTGFDENMDKYFHTTEKNEVVYVTELQQSQWVEGVLGRALDLSENAVLRKPLALASLATPLYGKKDDLSVQIWVKTLAGAPQGTSIIGNMLDEDDKSAGWEIYTQTSGAWGVILSAGKNTYVYQLNAPRQAINDGEWHQLCVGNFLTNLVCGIIAYHFLPKKPT